MAMNPPMNAHCTDVFTVDLLERLRTRYDAADVWNLIPFSGGTDCRQADPSYDIPTVTMMALGGYLGYHSSGDGPEILDPRMLKIHAVFAATFLYHLATAGPEDARSHLARCMEVGRAAIRDLEGRAFGEGRRDAGDRIDILLFDPARKYAALDYLEARETIRARSVLDLLDDSEELDALAPHVDRAAAEFRALADAHRRALGDAAAENLETELEPSDVARAKALVPVRLVAGDPWVENMPTADRGRISVSGSSPDVIWWADGRRTIYDCWRFSLTERPGTTLRGVLRYVDALVELGWVELRRA